MGLDMFLKVLRAFEGLATEFAFVGLEWNVDSNVRGDVVTLDSSGATATPLTGQVEVVGRFAADVALADMFIECLGRGATLSAALPLTLQILTSAVGKGCGRLAYEGSLTLLLWNDILRLLPQVGHRDELERE